MCLFNRTVWRALSVICISCDKGDVIQQKPCSKGSHRTLRD